MEPTLDTIVPEPLGLGWFVLATVLKISFILGLALLLYAPVFVLFERRQSAFVQDRVGPMQGGIKMPRMIIDNLEGLSLGAFGVAALSSILFVVSFVNVWLGRGEAVLFTEPIFGLDHTWNGLMVFFAVLAPLHLVLGRLLPYLFHHDRLTIFGGLHALFDAVKSFAKEDFVPPHADKLLFNLAPIIAMFPAFALAAVIPFGPTLHPMHLFEQMPAVGGVDGPAIALQVASLDIGILYMFAIGGTGIIGAAIAGYASDNKFALMGGLRAASQMVSYEVTLGLSLVGCFMLYDSLRLEDMIARQSEHCWGIFLQFPAFILFQTAAIAEYKRVPFDAPEGESEIVAGFFVEYSAMAFALFFLGEYANMILMSAMTTILFLGGWLGPFGILPQIGPIWFIFFLFAMVKAIVPRYRYDQLMRLGWKIFLPTSLTAVAVIGYYVTFLAPGATALAGASP